ncbi:hypothetical protein TSTA_077290 [Talaromyces stipitatus ATCC 10500]|uniref:WW-domain-binding protein n=1 Tax=Talaromyces stipitatus (strain ATCC 10500 / CBS 375.48 / QM 6759 / NRRL 1006) TaxID=441959 RepID=B8LVZ6_TALSN|nr:uncharacterized protein TSTA_077290 [Talaromyces stipitatus ATCC 10500]EED24363.1 hypothetical protein TSTA_077290 [Talaromyces stipitatus ATCC 10500]
MSLNWVMLSGKDGFVRLPNEHIIYTSPPRTALSLKPPSSWQGKEAFSISSSSGCLYLTNQRIVYLPSQPSEQMQSFTAPLLNLHDSHVSAPFFGPNAWTVLAQPVPGGGIPAPLQLVELKVTFKEGGAFDFHTNFERIKDRLQQAVEHARDSGSPSVRSSNGRGVNFTNVHLDELPAYDGPNTSNAGQAQSIEAAVQPPITETADTTSSAPVEPPPGYEEVQQQSVAQELEEQLRRAR